MLIRFLQLTLSYIHIVFKNTLHSYDNNALLNQHLRTINLLAILYNYKTPLITRSKHYNEYLTLTRRIEKQIEIITGCHTATKCYFFGYSWSHVARILLLRQMRMASIGIPCTTTTESLRIVRNMNTKYFQYVLTLTT